MGGKKARKRLEDAEQLARKIWRDIGVDKPSSAQLAAGILQVLEDKVKAPPAYTETG